MEAGEPFQVEVKTLWGVTWHGSGNEALRAWFARAHTPDSSYFPLFFCAPQKLTQHKRRVARGCNESAGKIIQMMFVYRVSIQRAALWVWWLQRRV